MSDARTSVGPYTILEGISEGGMSFVYKAIDESQNLTVALKVLKPIASEMMRRHRAAGQHAWEGDIALQLDHPHVIHTYERGEWRGQHYLAMELLDSFTLRYLTFAHSPLAKVNRYRLLDEVADGLAYVHQKGLIHRDVSPKNVLIDQRASAKIIDFGLTIPVSSAGERKDGRSGSVSYMAPEQLEGKPLNPSCDIYSFGVTMHEVLTGRLPRRAGAHARFAPRSGIKPSSLSQYDPSIPPTLDAIVFRALQEDPNDRFHTMDELRQALREAVPDELLDRDRLPTTEGRRFPRVAASCFATFTAVDPWGMGKESRTLTRDLSLDGARCIRMAHSLPKGARIDMKLWLRGRAQPLPIGAEVVWRRPGQEGDGGHEIGLRFSAISPDDREKLRVYLAAHGQGEEARS